MTQKQFLTRLQQLYAENLDISRRKNADYADQGDPFKNFRACELYGIKVEDAILVRMSDKMVRVGNLLKREAEVSDESIKDSLSDLANYAMILRMYLEQNAKEIN